MIEPIRVLVADDDVETRMAIAQIVDTDAALTVVAQAGDGREAVAQVFKRTVDVVLLDIRMPVLDGLSALSELRRHPNAARVIMLTTFGEAQYVRKAISLGADGFLLKSGDPHHLRAAIQAVDSGDAWLSPAVARMVADELHHLTAPVPAAQAQLDVLSPQEESVLALVAQGQTNAEIATALHLTENTVKGYVSSLLGRLGVRNRVEAALVSWTAGRD
jgi:DNA-binding NarL/FixJ family response regulator